VDDSVTRVTPNLWHFGKKRRRKKKSEEERKKEACTNHTSTRIETIGKKRNSKTRKNES
jgi:hypothetical protein